MAVSCVFGAVTLVWGRLLFWVFVVVGGFIMRLRGAEIPVFERKGIELNEDIYPWDLSDREKRTLNEANMIIIYNLSIRECSSEMGVSKSQIHRDLHRLLPGLSISSYCDIKSILKRHELNSDFSKNRRKLAQKR